MGMMKRLEAKANKHFKRNERMQKNGVKTKPLVSYRTDHHRVDDGWRERKTKAANGKQWRGAKGRTKMRRGPSQPKV